MSCKCHRCGRQYRVDVVIPNDIWERIRPDKTRPDYAGMLCGQCIMELIEELGEYSAFRLDVML